MGIHNRYSQTRCPSERRGRSGAEKRGTSSCALKNAYLQLVAGAAFKTTGTVIPVQKPRASQGLTTAWFTFGRRNMLVMP